MNISKGYEEFLAPSFDASKFAIEMLDGGRTAETLALEIANVEKIRKQLIAANIHVLTSQIPLLEKVMKASGAVSSNIASVDQMFNTVSLALNSSDSLAKLQIKKQNIQIALNFTTTIQKCVAISKKCELEAKYDQIDYLALSTYVSEYRQLNPGGGMKFMEASDLKIESLFVSCRDYARAMIGDSKNLVFTKPLDIFKNLRVLPEEMNRLEHLYVAKFDLITKESFKLFDIKSGGDLFFKKIEELADSIYEAALRITLIDAQIVKGNYDIQLQKFADKRKALMVGFWKRITQTFRTELAVSVKFTPTLADAIVSNIPRLMRIFTDLFVRLNISSSSKSDGEVEFTSIFLSYQQLYFSKSLTKLLAQTALALKPGSNSPESSIKLGRIFAVELDAVKFLPKILDAIALNLEKSIDLYRYSFESLEMNDATAYSISGTCSASQQHNINLVNSGITFLDQIWDIYVQYEQLSCAERLFKSTSQIEYAISTCVETQFLGILANIENELQRYYDFAGVARPGKELGVNELCARLTWISREFMKKFTGFPCVLMWIREFWNRVVSIWILYASLFATQRNILSDLKPFGECLRRCGYDDGSQILGLQRFITTGHDQNLGKIIQCHLLISATNGQIKNMWTFKSWTKAKYVEFVDSNTEDAVRSLICGTIDEYVTRITNEGGTEFCKEYIEIRELLN